MINNTICAGIVTYNPGIERLTENIAAIIDQVTMVYIVDNGSSNIKDIRELILQWGDKIHLAENLKNEGIAFALNQLMDMADGRFDWILTLDQDSVVQSDLIEVYEGILDKTDNVGILCCKMLDRNADKGKRMNPAEETKRHAVGICDIPKCITSASLTNVKAVLAVGGFDDNLFIDGVDDDICYALTRGGYRIVQADYIGLLHELGQSKTYHLFGKTFTVTNHSAFRKYYISRNAIILAKKYHFNLMVSYLNAYKRILTVLIFEQDKRNKISAIVKGIQDGTNYRKVIE